MHDYADILAECLPGSDVSAAIRSATASMASGGPGAAGPAVSVEPSAEALAAVQAVFARAPQLVANASADDLVSGAPLVASAAAGLKRQRISMSSFNLAAAAAAPSTSVFTVPSDNVPPTPPQHPISRRTSAPY